MTASEYLLRVLRGFVQGEDPGPFDGDWRELIELTAMHSVSGILGHSVMTYPHPDSAPFAQMMRQQCMQTMLLFSHRADAMARLSEILNAEGIDHLLFKGYIVRNYYPIPELRTFGDVDFVIRPEDRARCDAVMKQAGYTCEVDWEPVFKYLRQSELYEIHTEVLEVDVSEKADYRSYFLRIWDYAKSVDGHAYVLTPEFHLLYLLTHIAKHISAYGAGIRMYLDIAFYINHFRDTLDWTWFTSEAEKLCFTDFVNMTFALVEHCFGVKSPIQLHPVDEQVLQDFVDFTMEGGTFGRVGRDEATVNLKNQDRDEESVSKIRTLWRRLFPPVAKLEKRYTYLQQHPWLLPAAWIHRIFRNRDIWERRVQEVQGILSADEEQVLKLKRIYKEIGL